MHFSKPRKHEDQLLEYIYVFGYIFLSVFEGGDRFLVSKLGICPLWICENDDEK